MLLYWPRTTGAFCFKTGMESKSGINDKAKPNGKSTVKERERKKDHLVKPEEKNCRRAGKRVTEEMLEYYYQQSKELERCRRKYEEAVYWVYGTVPRRIDPNKFHSDMARLHKKNNLQA